MASKATLSVGDTMLSTMFSGRHPIVTDEEGYVFIDGDGKHFRKILNYLRRGDAVLPENEEELLEIKHEAAFYGIQGLVEQCELFESRIKEKRHREDVSKNQLFNDLGSIRHELSKIDKSLYKIWQALP